MTTFTIVIDDKAVFMGGKEKIYPLAKQYGSKATVRQFRKGDEVNAVPVVGATHAYVKTDTENSANTGAFKVPHKTADELARQWGYVK